MCLWRLRWGVLFIWSSVGLVSDVMLPCSLGGVATAAAVVSVALLLSPPGLQFHQVVFYRTGC